MPAFPRLRRPLISISALAGFGLVAGLVFVADRSTAVANGAGATVCAGLNVGKSDGCGRAYLTRAQFDETFAAVEAVARQNAKDGVVFIEQLRLTGTKRLIRTRPGNDRMVVRIRLASAD